jgi:hypothetical protein
VTKILTREEWELSVAEAWSKAIESGLRETVAQWMIERGYATGHGDTVEDLLKELEWQIREQEREACAEVATNWRCNGMPRRALGDAIRAREESK